MHVKVTKYKHAGLGSRTVSRYFELRKSVREGKRVRTQTVCYFGKIVGWAGDNDRQELLVAVRIRMMMEGFTDDEIAIISQEIEEKIDSTEDMR